MPIAEENKNLNPHEKILLKKRFIIPSDFTDPYMDIDFSVPKNAKKLGVRSSHERKESFPWIYISLFDPLTL